MGRSREVPMAYVSSRVSKERLGALAAKARSAIAGSSKIMIQLSHDVTTRSTGVGMALARTANIVEQAAHLHASGRQVSLICGGASGVGRQILENQNTIREPSPETLPIPSRPISITSPYPHPENAPSEQDLEALGTPNMMAVYETMFNVYGIRCGQIQLSASDLQSGGGATSQITGLQRMRTFPLINTRCGENLNPPEYGLPTDSRSCTAAVLAKDLGCDLLVLLSEAEGAYTAAPDAPDARVVCMASDALRELACA